MRIRFANWTLEGRNELKEALAEIRKLIGKVFGVLILLAVGAFIGFLFLVR